MLDWLRNVAVASPKPLTFLASVCTGSAILAKAGDVVALSAFECLYNLEEPLKFTGACNRRVHESYDIRMQVCWMAGKPPPTN